MMNGRQCLCSRFSFTMNIPDLDEVDIGFGCINLSSLNQNRGFFEHAIALGLGNTGTTARHLLEFVKLRAPRILIIENVLQLFSRYRRLNAVTKALEIDILSNLYTLRLC